MPTLRSDILEIGYTVGGPEHGPPVLLLHGWPDDVRGWLGAATHLQNAGWRTFAPYLRGFGATRFLSAATPRDGRAVALAQDAIDFVNALGLTSFAVAGHDWGARVAYTLAALIPERVSAIIGIALAYQPHSTFSLPQFSQARRFWYQWFMTLDGAPAAIAADPKGFARIQWDTWSPPGWFDDAEFEATATSFENPDWLAITLNAYRGRWRVETVDPRYEALQSRLVEIETVSTPTLMIQGGSDFCDEPKSSEGLECYFTGSYRRVVLEGIGHFPPREAPQAVARAIDSHLRCR